MKLPAAVAALFLAAACAPGPDTRTSSSDAPRATPGGGSAAPAPSGDGTSSGGGAPQDSLQRLIQRLEREAKQIAKAAPCADGGQCRTAPVGSRPCGGPREYIVYCATATDSAALFRTLDELARVEQEYNEKTGAVSTCEFRLPPETELTGNACRAVTTAP